MVTEKVAYIMKQDTLSLKIARGLVEGSHGATQVVNAVLADKNKVYVHYFFSYIKQYNWYNVQNTLCKLKFNICVL